MALIERTEIFLRESFDRSRWMQNHPIDKGYRLEHSYRVANVAGQIAEAEGMDVEGLVIGGLLHDISYSEDWGSQEEWINHGRRSARIARSFLEELALEPERVQEICYGIAIHVDDRADFPGEATVFARSVNDADNIDRFDVYRIYEWMHYDGFREMSLEEKEIWLAGKFEWINKQLERGAATETARRMLEERLNYQKEFFARLRQQLSRSTEICWRCPPKR